MSTTKLPDSKLQVVGRYRTPAEAEVLRVLLDEEGINACVHNAELLTAMWYYGAALGSVELVVLEGDAPQAIEKLEQFHHEAAARREIRAQDLPWAHEAERLQIESDEHEELAESKVPDIELIRAYRAAVIGSYTCWPFLSVYSIWLILDLELWKLKDWRLPAAITFNLFPFLVIIIQILRFAIWIPESDFNTLDFSRFDYWSQSESGFAMAVLSAALIGPLLVAIAKYAEKTVEPTAPDR